MAKHISRADHLKITEGSITHEELDQLVENMINAAVERALQSIPGVVDYLVRQTTHLKQLSDNFYSQNQDLESHRQTVASVIERLESKHPGKSYEQILEMAAKESRTLLHEKHSIDSNMNSSFDLSQADEDLGQL